MQAETEAGSATPATAQAPPDRNPYWPLVRRVVGLLYFAAIIWIVATKGVPTGRPAITVTILIGLGITRIGRGWRASGQVLLDWLPFTAVLVAYDQTRGVADHLGIPLHEADIAKAEAWLFGGTNPTIWLQHHLHPSTHVHWYDAACTLVYTSHFVATPVFAAILWLRNRQLWVRYVSRVITLALSGLVTYIAFPEAPPWLAGHDHVIGHVQRLSAQGWIWLHAGNLDALLSKAQSKGANPVAAMPSLHVAFACLIALFLGAQLRSPWRYLLVAYPLAMGFTLVYCGEHYVLDIVAGVLYAAGAHAAVSRWEQRRAARDRVPIAETTAIESDEMSGM